MNLQLKLPQGIGYSNPVVIMRRAVLMEDEGRPAAVRIANSRVEARQWIAAQAGQYFRPEDYYIVELAYR